MSWGQSVAPPPKGHFKQPCNVWTKEGMCAVFDTCIAKSIFSSFLQYCWPRPVRSLFHGLDHCCPTSTHSCCCIVYIHELVVNIKRIDCLTYLPRSTLCGEFGSWWALVWKGGGILYLLKGYSVKSSLMLSWYLQYRYTDSAYCRTCLPSKEWSS
jgi:hypothetical protein